MISFKCRLNLKQQQVTQTFWQSVPQVYASNGNPTSIGKTAVMCCSCSDLSESAGCCRSTVLLLLLLLARCVVAGGLGGGPHASDPLCYQESLGLEQEGEQSLHRLAWCNKKG
jgi:hypothetical protein